MGEILTMVIISGGCDVSTDYYVQWVMNETFETHLFSGLQGQMLFAIETNLSDVREHDLFYRQL